MWAATVSYVAGSLKDSRGKKVNPKALVEERAKPGGTGPRPWKYASLASGLTPTKLAGIFKKADEGDLQDILTLASEIERRDSHVGAQLRTRRLALAGLPWVMEAASDDQSDVDLADELQAIVNGHAFKRLVFHLTDAIFKPFSACEIVWSMGEKYIPHSFIWRDQRSFAVSPEDGETILLRTKDFPKGEEIEPWKYLIHTPRMFSGPLTTSGLVRPAAVMYSLKTLGLSAWLGYMEVFGIPWRIGRFPSNASEDDKETLAEAIQALGQDGGIVLPVGMDLEIQNAMGAGAGSQVHQQLADWCDRQTSKAILGQTLTSDTGGGSYAQGSVHDGIRRTLLVADAVDLAATIQRDLIEPYVLINYGEGVPAPVIRCQTEEPEDRKNFVDFLVPLIDRGFLVEQSIVRDKLGLPAPDEPTEGEQVSVLHPLGASESETA